MKKHLKTWGRGALALLVLIVILFAPLALFAEMNVPANASARLVACENWGSTNGVTNLAADVVTGAKIADDACDSEHYTDGSIDTAHLAADAVDGTKLADDAVDSEHLAAGSIDQEHYADIMVFSINAADVNFYVWTNVLSSGVHTQTFPTAFSAAPYAVIPQWLEAPGNVTNSIYSAPASWATNQCVITGDVDKKYVGLAVGPK